ncbi:hypothetical protein ACFE04_023149 [Oxalis oulophora]
MATTTTPVSEANDGPVLTVLNKRIRALKKKLSRITQMEESLTQGKTLNKEQQQVFNSKSSLLTLIDELDKLRLPLLNAVTDEIKLNQSQQPRHQNNENDVVEDVLSLLYFASMFDVKSNNDFTATMLTRTHERGCCLTYDYVNDDDDREILCDMDLDSIAKLGGLLISRRPGDDETNLSSHKIALQRCIEHAGNWIRNENKAIESNAADADAPTYAGLREKLKKIMASDYFTTTPQMKAPVEMAKAYVPMAAPPVHVEEEEEEEEEEEDSGVQDHHKAFKIVEAALLMNEYHQCDVQLYSCYDLSKLEEASTEFEEHETGDKQPEEIQKEGVETLNPEETVSVQTEEAKVYEEVGDNQGEEVQLREEQYNSRRSYYIQRGDGRGGGGGARRGYTNNRGGRGNGRGGGYQNGRNYDQPGNYYPRNYNNNNRGGRGGRGGSYNNNNHHGQGGYSQGDVGVSS